MFGLNSSFMFPRITLATELSFGQMLDHDSKLEYDESMTVLVMNNAFKFNIIKPKKHVYWNIGPGFSYLADMSSEIETQDDYGTCVGTALGFLFGKSFLEMEYKQTMFGNGAPFLTLSVGYSYYLSSK